MAKIRTDSSVPNTKPKKKKQGKFDTEGNEKHIRNINIQLILEGIANIRVNKHIDDTEVATDFLMNKYVESGNVDFVSEESGARYNYINGEERAKAKKELAEKGIFVNPESGVLTATHLSSVFGHSGANKLFKARIDKILDTIREKSPPIRKIEAEKPGLLIPESVWFDGGTEEIHGQTCIVCGGTEDIFRKGNEPGKYEEYMCNSCFELHREYQATIYDIKRKGKLSDLIFPDVIDYIVKMNADPDTNEKQKIDLPQLLIKKAARLRQNADGKPKPLLEHTAPDKAMLWHDAAVVKKIDVENCLVYIQFYKDEPAIPIKFYGGEYLTNNPKYGLDAKHNSFAKLIEEHINITEGSTFLFRQKKEGKATKYFLGIPVNYPVKKIEKQIAGAIIVTNRYVLLYVLGTPKFKRLHRHFVRKEYHKKLKAKTDSANELIKKENKVLKDKGLPTKPLIKMPRAYSDGALLKYIRTQTHFISRESVEQAKKMLKWSHTKKNIVMLNMKKMHPENGEGVKTPIAQLNEAIYNKLSYDGLGEQIGWGIVRDNMLCPMCNTKIPAKSKEWNQKNPRLFIRDSIINLKNNWSCSNPDCLSKNKTRYSLNPVMVIARNAIRIANKKDKFDIELEHI